MGGSLINTENRFTTSIPCSEGKRGKKGSYNLNHSKKGGIHETLGKCQKLWGGGG